MRIPFTDKTFLKRRILPRLVTGLVMLAAVLAASLPATAKVYIDIDSPGGKRLPIAIQRMTELKTNDYGAGPTGGAARKDADTYKLGYLIMDALNSDVEFSGFFEILDQDSYIEEVSDSGLTRAETDFSLWRTIDAELLIKSVLLKPFVAGHQRAEWANDGLYHLNQQY